MVARIDLRNTANADGDWFVDTRCIDCGTCREIAPDVFADDHGSSVVRSQPDDGSQLDAWLAAQACPTSSIGTMSRQRRPGRLYPGRSSPARAFSTSATARRTASARRRGSSCARRATCWSTPPATPTPSPVRSPTSAVSATSLLTHRDDVADAHRWATQFHARSWIHADDASAARWATDLLTDEHELQPGLLAIPVPGHTKGVGRLPARRPMAVQRRLARLEPRAPRPHGLPQRVLVLVDGADRVARPPGRAPPLRGDPPRPRRPPPRRP